MAKQADTLQTWLITGGAGFIGSHLAERLIQQGKRVLAIDNLSTGSLANVLHLLGHPRFHLARASIDDAIVMDRLASQADMIVHLAAAVGVQLVVEKPTLTIESNVLGTDAVLKVALRYGCQVLLASTSEVYGKGTRIPFNEQDDVLLGPTSMSRWSYAASKMVDEFLGLAYHREHGLKVTIARLFNTVGPRQTGRYGMVVPRFVQQALADEPITVYGDGTQSRCFCHVADVTDALLRLAAEPDLAGQVFNVGSTQEITIAGLADRVIELAASRSPIVYQPYDQAYAPGFQDMHRRVPDITRIRQAIGWQPRHSLGDILQQVIDYHRAL